MMKAAYLLPLVALVAVGCRNDATDNGKTTVGQAQPIKRTVPAVPARHLDSIQRTYHLDDLQRVTLKANGHEIPTWVMDTGAKRQEGMMWLTWDDVADDDGMIFAFPAAENMKFWMKDTILSLDIIFISEKDKVLNIQEGKAQDDKTQLPSKGAAKYALEMKQGAAKRLGIVPGTKFTIPDTVVGKP